jgi:hypothetical protein
MGREDSFSIGGPETLAEAARLLVEDSHDHHAILVEVADVEIRELRRRLAGEPFMPFGGRQAVEGDI